MLHLENRMDRTGERERSDTGKPECQPRYIGERLDVRSAHDGTTRPSGGARVEYVAGSSRWGFSGDCSSPGAGFATGQHWRLRGTFLCSGTGRVGVASVGTVGDAWENLHFSRRCVSRARPAGGSRASGGACLGLLASGEAEAPEVVSGTGGALSAAVVADTFRWSRRLFASFSGRGFAVAGICHTGGSGTNPVGLCGREISSRRRGSPFFRDRRDSRNGSR